MAQLKHVAGRELPAGRTVAVLDHDDLVGGCVDAIIDALRNGVPVEQLPGQTVFASAHVHQSVDSQAQQREYWTSVLKDARHRMRRARDHADDPNNSDAETDDYRRRAREQEKRADHAQRQLNKSFETVDTGASSAPFDVMADVWLPALAKLRNSRALNQREFHALKTVLTDFRIIRREHRWVGQVHVQVNTKNGAAILGPIEWVIEASARGNHALASRISTGQQPTPLQRKSLEMRLQSAGVRRDAIHTLLNAPFPQLVHIVAHRTLQDPLPDWVEGRWRDEVFMNWIATVYTAPDWKWLIAGRYTHVPHSRQLYVDLLAELGPSRGRDLRTDRPYVHVPALDRAAVGVRHGKRRPIQPNLQIVEHHYKKTERIYAPMTCECGQPATIAVLVPEVVTDLLCGCGRMVGPAATDAPRDLLFPEEYQGLRLSREECIEQIERTARKRDIFPQRHRDILEHLVDSGAPLTAPHIRRVLFEGDHDVTPTKVGHSLRVLKQRGFIEYIPSPASRTGTWAAVEAGREHVNKSRTS